ncbi:uncharacterized protein EV422DRAFT_99618 [Fimicolochytrium jonesii]|uniref:uncharacterized protein n=1 Tax=Fimicolochytrium jonesii TaxID=1396493 RepID=UPI0022FEAFCC|nr:uncharacterized protein EV422DRAFT_99618 [Fimicolochytrium jonesii]KAI8819619.1 hypothetical protein EV422DRAFT_99618 [Fimicolochytrium jonesii]
MFGQPGSQGLNRPGASSLPKTNVPNAPPPTVFGLPAVQPPAFGKPADGPMSMSTPPVPSFGPPAFIQSTFGLPRTQAQGNHTSAQTSFSFLEQKQSQGFTGFAQPLGSDTASQQTPNFTQSPNPSVGIPDSLTQNGSPLIGQNHSADTMQLQKEVQERERLRQKQAEEERLRNMELERQRLQVEIERQKQAAALLEAQRQQALSNERERMLAQHKADEVRMVQEAEALRAAMRRKGEEAAQAHQQRHKAEIDSCMEEVTERAVNDLLGGAIHVTMKQFLQRERKRRIWRGFVKQLRWFDARGSALNDAAQAFLEIARAEIAPPANRRQMPPLWSNLKRPRKSFSMFNYEGREAQFAKASEEVRRSFPTRNLFPAHILTNV